MPLLRSSSHRQKPGPDDMPNRVPNSGIYDLGRRSDTDLVCELATRFNHGGGDDGWPMDVILVRGLGGATVLTRDGTGLIVSVRIYHRPFLMVELFSAERAKRLRQKIHSGR